MQVKASHIKEKTLLKIGLIILTNVITISEAEVTLSPSTQNIAEKSPVTLTCSYTGRLTVSTYNMYISSALQGSLLADCSVFTKQPDPALYDYTCPTSKQLSWTIRNITRANDGETWTCYAGFTRPGSEEAAFTINVQVPIQNVVMVNPTNDVITIQENTEIEFVCRTSGGLPSATVRWFKDQTTTDDEEITSFATTSMSSIDDLISVRSTLRYSPGKGDNGVKIYCTARNSATTLTSSRKPQLNVYYSPEGPPIIQNFTNGATCSVIENVQRTLFCSIVGGNPKPTLSWNCFNIGSTATTVGSILTKTVTFRASRRQDKSCICQSAHSVAGMQTVSVNVQVLYQSESPSFKVNGNIAPSPIKFIQDKTRSVVCESNGKPNPNIYTWTKGGQNFRTGNTLIFKDVQRQDDSQYTCTAENTMIASDGLQKTGRNSSILQVIVLFPPTKPSLYFGGINGQLILGNTIDVVRRDTFTIACSSEGQPEPSFKWSGQTSNSQILTISSIKNNLIKTCTSTNTMRETYGVTEQGSAATALTINVLYPPSITNCQLMYTPGSSIAITDSINVKENNSFTLICSANSKPAANISWPGTGMSSSTLSLYRISRHQNGTYTVVAENTMKRTFGDAATGRDTENFYFNVLYPPKLRGLSKENILAGSRLNLSCPYEKGNPQKTTFKWTRNGDNREWNIQILFIENVTKHDDMMYTCTVKNEMKPTGDEPQIGQDSESFHLNVLYQSTILSFVVDGKVNASSVTVNENNPLRFGCIIDSHPNSSVEIAFKDKVIYRQYYSNTVLYNYKAASCLDAGVYTCSARNRYNYGNASVAQLKLDVNCSPRPLHQTKSNFTSKLNDTVTLNITTIAYPEPGTNGFAWYKQNSFTWVPLLNNADLLITSSGLQTSLTIKRVFTSDFGHYRVTVKNDIGEYNQYLYLTEERQTTTMKMITYHNNSSLIVGVILGSLLTAVTFYAVVITIYLKRKCIQRENQSTTSDKLTKTATYANLSYQADDSVEAFSGSLVDETAASNQEKDDPTQQYTDLAHFSNDDQKTYDVIQKV